MSTKVAIVETNDFALNKTGRPMLQQKIKVLFVIDTLQLGGAEQSLLANAVHFQNINPVVCHLYKGEILKSKFEEKGIKVYSCNIKWRYSLVEGYSKLKKIVAAEKPQLIVGYITRSEIVARLVGKHFGIPVIGTFINDLYSKTYNQHLSKPAKWMVSLFKYINKITARGCVGFVANSQAIKDANAKHLAIDPAKIQVINRGRESAKIIPKKNYISNPAEPVRFFNVSRLFRVKGHRELILGFNKVKEKYPLAKLHIVGDGPLRSELENIIKANNLEDKVELLGARSDVPTLLHQYDCFVFPSFEEGFSGAVVEAMFAGLPVLASNIGPNREAITHLQTGYMFEKESAEEVEKAMLWYMQNITTANAFAQKAHALARQKFELKNIAAQLEQYLQKAVSKF